MDSKGDAEPQEERPSSPMRVLQHFSGSAFKAAGEALHMSPMGPGGHRRCQSELGSRGVERNNSLQKLKSHVNKAWRWGGKSREDALSNFNPEVMANQKRQWYQLHPKSLVFIFFRIPSCAIFIFESIPCFTDPKILMEFNIFMLYIVQYSSTLLSMMINVDNS